MTDIRTLVRLMCLAAAGRAGLSTSPATVSSSTERSRGIHSKTSKPISCLAYLSTAVGCLASNTPSAAKLLVQLCTQVGLQCLLEITTITCTYYNYLYFYLLSWGETALTLRISLESFVGKNEVAVCVIAEYSFQVGKMNVLFLFIRFSVKVLVF